MRMSKSTLRILIISLVSIAAFFAFLAFYLNPIDKLEFVSDEIIFSDDLRVIAKLKDNSLFEKKEIETDKIFVNITESCNALYKLNLICSKCDARGNYSIEAILETKDWSKEMLKISNDFVDFYSISIPIDFQGYISTYERISSELGYRASEPKVTIRVSSSAANYTYTRTITLQIAEKLLKITVDEPKTKKFVEKDTTIVERGEITIIKYLLAVLSALLFVLAVVLYKKVEVYEGDRFKKYEGITVKAKSASSEKIELESFEEILKLSEYLNKPIIRLGDEFLISDGSTTYIVRIK
ncbi:MAG: DUF5305 family protein [Archaeoglobales archaeon]|nr:DUF5305 family protein [Archaeoglobales archaeon]